MLFRRRNSTASRRREVQEAQQYGRPSHDGRKSFSDCLSRKSFDLRQSKDNSGSKRQRVVKRSQDLPRPSSNLPAPARPALTGRYSEDASRASVNSWIMSQQGVDQVPELPDVFRHCRRDAAGELRTSKGDSLSLFPRPALKRSSSSLSLRPGSRASLASGSATHFSSPMRASTERLADGLRTSGRRLRHSASKLSLVSAIDDSDEAEKYRVLKSPCKAHAPHRCNCSVPLICPISQPLDFRHVTHALPQQFKNMSVRSQSDLVADFSTVRASQVAQVDVRGIKTQNLRSCRSSIDGTASSQLSTVPSLVSSSSYDSLQSARPSSQSSDGGTVRSSSTMVSRQSSIILARSKGSFSRPFVNGRPPRVDSLPRLYQPSYRTFSMPFYAGKPEDDGQVHDEAVSASPVDNLLSALDNWSTSFAPELPTLNEAEVFTLTPTSGDNEVKIFPTTRLTHHLSNLTSPSTPPVKVQTIIVASDR